MNTRKAKRLERAINQLFNSDDDLSQTEVVLPVFLTMLTEALEDDNQPMLSIDDTKDALERASIPLNVKLAVKKQLIERGYINEDVTLELIEIIKGEIKWRN